MGFYVGLNYYSNKYGYGQEARRWDYERAEDNRKFSLFYGGYNKKINEKLQLKIDYQFIKSKLWGQYFSGRWPVKALQVPDETTIYEFTTWMPNKGPRIGHTFTMLDYNNEEAKVLDETVNDTIILQNYYSSFVDYLIDQQLVDENNITKENLDTYLKRVYTNKNSKGSNRHKMEIFADYQFNKKHALSIGYAFDRIYYVGLAITNGGNKDYSNVDIPLDLDKRGNAYTTVKHGVFAQYQGNLLHKRLWLTIGARLDHQNVYGSSFNPRSGFVFRLFKTSLIKLVYGESFREPNVFELSGNPNIKPSKMRSLELGLNQRILNTVILDAHIYRSKATNYLSSISASAGDDVVTVDNQTVSGIEYMCRFEKKKISAFLGGSYLLSISRRINTNSGKEDRDVLSVPKFKTSVGVSYNFIKNWRVSLNNFYVQKTKALGGATGKEITLDAYNDLVLTVFAKKVKLHSKLDIDVMLSVKNLLNQEYYHANIRASGTEKFLQNSRNFTGRIYLNF